MNENINEKRYQPGFTLPRPLWQRFKASCALESIKEGYKIQELIEEYLRTGPLTRLKDGQ